MTFEKEEHEKQVCLAIERALYNQYLEAEEMVVFLGGPDPELVMRLYKQIKKKKPELFNRGIDVTELARKELIARRKTSNLPLKFPDPNPLYSQWWFTLDTICYLSKRVWSLAEKKSVAFLGTTTVGYHYSNCYNFDTLILDIDSHLLESLEIDSLSHVRTKVFDAKNSLSADIDTSYSVVLIDPPWYQPYFSLFLLRACQLLGDKGFILCALPSRLTRPGLIEEKTALIKELLDKNFEILALDSDVIKYSIPYFERRAFEEIGFLTSRVWRRGDLLVIRKKSSTELLDINNEEIKLLLNITPFKRPLTKRRFFLFDNKINYVCPSSIVESVEGFSKSISKRLPSKSMIIILYFLHTDSIGNGSISKMTCGPLFNSLRFLMTESASNSYEILFTILNFCNLFTPIYEFLSIVLKD